MVMIGKFGVEVNYLLLVMQDEIFATEIESSEGSQRVGRMSISFIVGVVISGGL